MNEINSAPLNTLPAYQREVASFVQKFDLETPVENRLLDLISEVGELAKEALKGNDYGRAEFDPTEIWEDEIGDVFFSLICVANTSGILMQKALQRAMTKYHRRIIELGGVGSGD